MVILKQRIARILNVAYGIYVKLSFFPDGSAVVQW